MKFVADSHMTGIYVRINRAYEKVLAVLCNASLTLNRRKAAKRSLDALHHFGLLLGQACTLKPSVITLHFVASEIPFSR